MLKKLLFITLAVFTFQFSHAQPDRWQQRAEYKMDIDFDVATHQFAGKQTLKYYNNSLDDLNNVFYHLYLNAFQPGSMMDIRNQTLPDADRRVAGRIGALTPEQIGFTNVLSLKQNGKEVKFEIVGTILEVALNEPIKSGGSATFEMEFRSQVPVQIRRNGRDNKEGISYSMSQWYPKMCEYDYQGWHANPYIGREFHGIWGDFDVNITIDRNYIVGGTGYLQNPQGIGYGYEKKGSAVNRPDGDKLTWKFTAPNVHDFVWAADPDYKHTSFERDDLTMHFLFQPGEATDDNWARLPSIMDKAFDFINKTYGKYPYKQYSFIQGGDGGMEYPMATLITGERSLNSLVGVSVHELMHSWYQMILGTNEALYAWMDEGFTSYASAEVMNYLTKEGLLPGREISENPHFGSTSGLTRWAKSGYDEALITHADHFNRNQAYGVAAYTKGSVYLNELNYIVGKENFDQAMLTYYNTWKFKHPNPNDFIRIMEKQSNLELDWFDEYFVKTTKYPDYKVANVSKGDGKKKIKITLEKLGIMPMPIDLTVTYKNGDTELYTIPLRIMRGEKTMDGGKKLMVLEDWPWVNPTYELELDGKLKKIKSVEIDASKRMIDMNYEDNSWSAGEKKE